tara:strand:+ start:123 stop:359 length:237 start_codon:yes stop_codon:yes gene_type:complete
MLPSLEGGDVVMTSNLVEIKKNDIVVLNDASYGIVVKRITTLEDDYFKVKSDNLKTDSPVCAKSHLKKNIIGKVISVL